MKPRVSTKLMGYSSTKIQGLLFLLLPLILRTSAGTTITCGTWQETSLPRLTHINAWQVFVIGYRRGLLALYGKFESFTWWQRFPVLNFTLLGVKVGLSSQYKLRRAKRENKVLASKQNLSNESEEGTNNSLKIMSDQLVDPPNRCVQLFLLAKLCNNYLWMCDHIKNAIRAEQQKFQQ